MSAVIKLLGVSSSRRLAVVHHHLTAGHTPHSSMRCFKRPITKAAGSSNTTYATSAIDRLENVLNARDLATATPLVAPGRIFRSGNPSNGTLKDVKTLRLELGINQMLDFRSTEEHKEDTGWSLMMSNGEITCYDTLGNITSISIDHNAALKGVELPECQLHRLSLLERERFIRALLWRLPAWKVAQAVAYKVMGYSEQMRETLVPEINKGGLPLVYKILMDTAAADIRRTLEIITEGAERHDPQLIFCRLGKDRTGLMAALILACCGATDDEIVIDYAKSDGVDAVALGGLEKMQETQGMDQHLFASAPPEAMREVLQYAGEQYGGMTAYMRTIGFTTEKQAKLAAALSPETTW